MTLNFVTDKIVFNFLQLIKTVNFELVNYDSQKYVFGILNDELKVKIKINKPWFTFQIIKNGSIGLAES